MSASSEDCYEERCSSPFFSLPPPPPPPPILLCLFCGNLGAGKTTILQSLLTSFSPRTSTTENTTKWFPENAPVSNFQTVQQKKKKGKINGKKKLLQGVMKGNLLSSSSCSAVEKDKQTTNDGVTSTIFSSSSAALPVLLPNRILTIINEYSAYSIDSLAFMPSKEWLPHTSSEVRNEKEESFMEGGVASPPVQRMPQLPEQKLQQQVLRVLHPEMHTDEKPLSRAENSLKKPSSSFKDNVTERQEEKNKKEERGSEALPLPYYNTTVDLSGGCTCCNLLPALAQVLKAAAEYNEKQYKLFLLAWEEAMHTNSRTHQNAALLMGTNETSGAGSDKREKESRLTLPATHSFSAGVAESDASPFSSSSSFSHCFPYYTYIFLECTGVGESLPIAATLLSLPSLSGRVVMDLIVTVVDARALLALVPMAPSAPLKKTNRKESHVGGRTTDMQGKQTSRRKTLLDPGKRRKRGTKRNVLHPTSLSSSASSTLVSRTGERKQLLQESGTKQNVQKKKIKRSGDHTQQKKTHHSPRMTQETNAKNIICTFGRKKIKKCPHGTKKRVESAKVYPLQQSTTKKDLALLHPFLISHGGLTKETLKGTNAIVINAWEEAVITAYRRLQMSSATPPLQSEGNGKTAASLRWSAVVAHLHRLVKALVRYSVDQTALVWKNFKGVRSSASSSFASGIPSMKVEHFFTNRGDFASVFFSQLYRKELFSNQFLSGGPQSEKKNYFLMAYGAVRVNALREGRFIALVKKEKKRRERNDETPHSALKEESEDEWIEVNMETEEAREREKLGLHQFTLPIPSYANASLSPKENGHSSCRVLRISILRKVLRTPAGESLFRNVWRSKGFFYALDDDEDGRGDGEQEVDPPPMSNAENVERLPLPAACDTPVERSLKRKQFRWQTAGRHIRFGEVLPPYVPLFSQVMEEDENLNTEREKKGALDERGSQKETTALDREKSEASQKEKEERRDNVDATMSSSPIPLSALIVFLGTFSATPEKEDEKKKEEWQKKMRSLFETGELSGSFVG